MTDAPLSIIEALDTPNLLGGPTWRAWRVFLRALFGLPMDAAELAIYQHHTGRQTPPAQQSRYGQLVVGRRGGKSRVLGVIACYLATCLDHAPYMVAGETPVIAIIAADRRQARVIFGYITGTLRRSPILAGMIADELTESVRLSNGVLIEIHTGSIGAPRGRTFLAVLADESAFWAVSGDSANPDVEVINAVRPGLSTIPYSLLLIASSPYAKRGVLYTNYAKYFGHDNAPVLVWQGTTEEMNPSLLGDALIAEMYREDPERASAEFGAQFRTDVVAFITREAVEACLARGTMELPPGGGITYVGHVDPSGGSADSMTLAIAHLDESGLAVLDGVREVKPPFSPDAVVGEFADVLRSYGIARVTGDAYAGKWPRERFAVHGIFYDVSKKNTSAIYTEFLPALNARRVQLLDLPRLVGQLVGLERRTARGGRDSVAHPPGSHDDVANAACGALVQVLAERRPNLVRGEDLLVNGEPTVPNLLGRVWSNSAFSVFAANKRGEGAVVHCVRAAEMGLPLVFVDFDLLPMNARSFHAVMERSLELAAEYRSSRGVVAIVVPPALLMHATTAARTQGLNVMELPIEAERDPYALALRAGWHSSCGSIKIAPLVHTKSESSPFGGALSFKAGLDDSDDPLRQAALYAVKVALENQADMVLRS